MKLYEKILRIHLSKIIAGGLIIFIVIALYYYYVGDEKSKATLLLGGLCASLIVAFIQFLFSWNEHIEIEEIKKIRVKKILPYRDDENFYRELIIKANNRIWVMGVTALRFMKDFGDEQRGRPEKKILIDALQKKVTVKILVPKLIHHTSENKKNLQISENYFSKTKKSFSNNFHVKYFDHIPAHSIVVVDDMCLLGPVFPHLESKDTPCIFMSVSNEFARKYINYFEEQWNNASDNSN